MANENQNTFFADSSIENGTKIGAIALILKGTNNIETTSDGKNKVLNSLVCTNGIVPIMVGIGTSNVSNIACLAILKKLGLDTGYGNEPDGIFKGIKTDEQICNDLFEKVSKIGLNQTGLSEILDGIVKNLKNYLDLNEIPGNQKEALIAHVEAAFDPSKKKQTSGAVNGLS